MVHQVIEYKYAEKNLNYFFLFKKFIKSWRNDLDPGPFFSSSDPGSGFASKLNGSFALFKYRFGRIQDSQKKIFLLSLFSRAHLWKYKIIPGPSDPRLYHLLENDTMAQAAHHVSEALKCAINYYRWKMIKNIHPAGFIKPNRIFLFIIKNLFQLFLILLITNDLKFQRTCVSDLKIQKKTCHNISVIIK